MDKTIFLSMHLLLWMNVILDFIFTGFAGIWVTGKEQKIENENKYLQPDLNHEPVLPRYKSNPAPLTFPLRFLRCLNVLTTPVGWLSLLQLTVLSRSEIVVKSKFLVACLCFHVAFWNCLWCRGFCHRTESDLFLFLLQLLQYMYHRIRLEWTHVGQYMVVSNKYSVDGFTHSFWIQ